MTTARPAVNPWRRGRCGVSPPALGIPLGACNDSNKLGYQGRAQGQGGSPPCNGVGHGLRGAVPRCGAEGACRGPLPRVRRSRAAGGQLSAGALASGRRRARGRDLVLQRLSGHGPPRGGARRRHARRCAATAPAPAARATSPAPPICTSCSRRSWPTCTASRRPSCSPRATSPTRPPSAPSPGSCPTA